MVQNAHGSHARTRSFDAKNLIEAAAVVDGVQGSRVAECARVATEEGFFEATARRHMKVKAQAAACTKALIIAW